MRAQYQHNMHRNRAEIILIDDRDTCLVMTVNEASDLISGLSEAVARAFYDFTASTPNTGAPAQDSHKP